MTSAAPSTDITLRRTHKLLEIAQRNAQEALCPPSKDWLDGIIYACKYLIDYDKNQAQ
jgi:hypothetical protein